MGVLELGLKYIYRSWNVDFAMLESEVLEFSVGVGLWSCMYGLQC